MSNIDALLSAARVRINGDPDSKIAVKRKTIRSLVDEIDLLRSEVRAVKLPNQNSIGRFHRKARATEVAAALAVYPRSGTQREAVLIAIASCNYDGATDHQICELTGLKPNTARPRRVELVEGGWIVDSNLRRKTGDGGEGVVWVVTDRTRAVLNERTRQG